MFTYAGDLMPVILLQSSWPSWEARPVVAMQAPMAARTTGYSASRDEGKVPLGSGSQSGYWAHCQSFMVPVAAQGLGTLTSLL